MTSENKENKPLDIVNKDTCTIVRITNLEELDSETLMKLVLFNNIDNIQFYFNELSEKVLYELDVLKEKLHKCIATSDGNNIADEVLSKNKDRIDDISIEVLGMLFDKNFYLPKLKNVAINDKETIEIKDKILLTLIILHILCRSIRMLSIILTDSVNEYLKYEKSKIVSQNNSI